MLDDSGLDTGRHPCMVRSRVAVVYPKLTARQLLGISSQRVKVQCKSRRSPRWARKSWKTWITIMIMIFLCYNFLKNCSSPVVVSSQLNCDDWTCIYFFEIDS